MTRFMKRPTLFTLFSGIGGIDIGFMQAGFQVVGANEWDAAAAITYMTNLCSLPVHIHYLAEADQARLDREARRLIKKNDKGEVEYFPQAGTGWIKSVPEIPPVKDFWFGDVCKLKGYDILDTLNMDYGEITCVAGGPPCQGFSHAGKREVGDKRNKLVYEMARLITELMPQTFFVENVPGLRTMTEPDGTLVIDNFLEMVRGEGYSDTRTTQQSKIVLDAYNSISDPQTKLWGWA